MKNILPALLSPVILPKTPKLDPPLGAGLCWVRPSLPGGQLDDLYPTQKGTAL